MAAVSVSGCGEELNLLQFIALVMGEHKDCFHRSAVVKFPCCDLSVGEGRLVIIGDIVMIGKDRWCHQYRKHFIE
jgi:hypothetical protein